MTTNNYAVVAQEVVTSITGLAGVNSLVNGVLVGAEVQPKVSVTGFIKDRLPMIVNRFGRSGQQFTGVVTTDTLPCSTGGFLTLQLNDANGNDQPDPGDVVTLTGNNCKEQGATINGTLRMTVNSFSGDADYPPYSLSMAVVADNLKIVYGDISEITNGNLEMSLSANSSTSAVIDVTSNATIRTTGPGIDKLIKTSNYRIRSELTPSQSRLTVNGSINVPSLGANTVTVDTVTPFVASGSGYFTSGQAVMRAVNGGQVRITANGSANALVEFDANSDGTYETSTTSMAIF